MPVRLHAGNHSVVNATPALLSAVTQRAQLPPLRVGSPDARAAHQVLSGAPLIAITDISPGVALSAGARLARILTDHQSWAEVMFLTDDLAGRKRLAGRLRNQFSPKRVSPFISVWQGRRATWTEHASRTRGVQSVWVSSPDQPKGTMRCDVLIVLGEYVTSPFTIADADVHAPQVVILGPTAEDLLTASQRKTERQVPIDWGEMPLDVLLAGGDR